MAGLADLVIGVSGNIGSGKTTLIQQAKNQEFRHILLSLLDDNPSATREITALKEEVTKKVIEAFYHDPKTSAFLAQINFFNARLRREYIVNRTPGIVLVDRPIQEDYHVFGKAQCVLGNMSELEFTVYEENFREMTRIIPPPDLYVYLKAPVPVLQQRIKIRNLPEEQGITGDPTYLQTLHNLYDEFFRSHANCPVIEIDATKMASNPDQVDKRYIRDVLVQIADEIRRRKSVPKLTPRLGKWLSYNPTEAVIESISLEDQLRDYLQQNQTLTTLAGNIGLGKTAWARILSRGLQIQGNFELDAHNDDIDDKLLHDFLLDKPRYCYDLQQHLLKKRLSQRKKSLAAGQSCIEDRTPEEDPIVFHNLFRQQGLLTESQYDHLQIESRRAYQDSPPSQLLIVLLGSPELSWLRIQQRSRPEELSGGWQLEKDLQPLAKLYEEFPGVVKGYGLHRGPTLVFDVERVDITNRAHQGFVYEQMLQALKSD